MTAPIAPLLRRHLEPVLRDALETARVVNLIGPRQAGKTTLVRDLFAGGRFVTLDDDALRAAIDDDPHGQLTTLVKSAGSRPLIVDEAQRSPSLALAVKRIVDADRRPGQFLLTGSSNVFTTLAVADSLAGRLRTCRLWPLSAAEMQSRPVSRLLDRAVKRDGEPGDWPSPDPLSRSDYIELVVQGGYPEAMRLSVRARQDLLRDYVDTIVDRDVADLLRIRKSDALRRLIDQLAVRTSSLSNMAGLGELVGVKRQTVDQYIDLLERLALVVRLDAWTPGESRRAAKRPKLHFADTGIAAALRDRVPASFDADADPTALGGLLASFVVGELLRSLPLQEERFRLWHWSDLASRREIDIIAESRNRLVAIEIKASRSITTSDLRHLKWFASDGPGARRQVTSILFYLGDETLVFGERLYALPVSALWADR